MSQFTIRQPKWLPLPFVTEAGLAKRKVAARKKKKKTAAGDKATAESEKATAASDKAAAAARDKAKPVTRQQHCA